VENSRIGYFLNCFLSTDRVGSINVLFVFLKGELHFDLLYGNLLNIY